MQLTWADGVTSQLPHAILRGYCPCASCQGHGSTLAFKAGGALELREIEQVGNYALGLGWADGHNTGIYSFRYLRTLGDLVAEHGTALPERVPTLSRVH